MEKKSVKRFITDFIYGIGGLVAMNGMQSLAVYPFLNRVLGDSGQGKMLFYTSLMGIMASAFGSGINYARMKISTTEKTVNGDYNWALAMVAFIAAVVTAGGILIKGDAAGENFLTIFVLIMACVLRYYADVQFRLDLNYRGFFFFYIIIAVGYGLGILLYRLIPSWVLVFLCGEIAGFVYVILIRGSILKRPFWKRSPHFLENLKVMGTLSGAYFMSDFVSYTDRMMMSLLVSDAAATHLYVASIVGKMTSLLSTPLNGVIAGHLSRYQGKFTRKMLMTLFAILSGIAVVFALGTWFGSFLYIKLFYPDMYSSVKDILFLANAGQVFFFMANVMMVVVLRFASEKNQMLLGVVYTVLFFAVVLPLMMNFGIWGAVWGLFGINLFKFIFITFLGWRALGKGKITEAEEGEGK